MSHLSIRHVSLRHCNGDMQFSNLNFTLPRGLCGLVGENGAGKSLLAKIMVGERQASSGSVEAEGDFHYLSQDTQLSFERLETIADHFGVADKLLALANIASGSIAEEDYQIVNDDWMFEEKFKAQLQDLSLRLRPSTLLAELSGGELNLVMLSALFIKCAQQNGILILDEPSNHLDHKAKAWLAQQLANFEGQCLLISHDRALLNLCQNIAHLSTAGLSLYKGNYDAFEAHSIVQDQARINQFTQLQASKKKAIASAQRDTEKAQKRAIQGQKKGKKGGIPRVLLGAKKSQAETSASAKMAQHQTKLKHLSEQLTAFKDDSTPAAIKFQFTSDEQRSKRLLYANSLTLAHSEHAFSIEVKQGEKWHLHGANGCGKSTFFCAINAMAKRGYTHNTASFEAQKLGTGLLSINCDVYMLDQHCSLLRGRENMLANLSHFCPNRSDSDIRTLLGANGFRKDKVFQQVDLLSGGERMRLAMLIVSLQENSLILLDEPDNHLDMASKAILSEALSRFQRSYILISHDQHFVSQCGISHHYEM